jgi:SAM-dependent methyltransferase
VVPTTWASTATGVGSRKRPRLEAAVDGLDASGVVLEIACGTGIFTGVWRLGARRLIAEEAAATTLAINRERVGEPRMEYLHADLFDWEPPHGRRFDLIFFAFLVFPHPAIPVRGVLGPAHWLARTCRPGLLLRRRRRGRRSHSNQGQGVEDGPDFAHRRRLLDGREYMIVKVFHEPDGLSDALAAIGWEADIRTTGHEFYYGLASVSEAP